MKLEERIEKRVEELREEFRKRNPETSDYQPRFRTLRWLIDDINKNPDKYLDAYSGRSELFETAQVFPYEDLHVKLHEDTPTTIHFVRRRSGEIDSIYDWPLTPSEDMWYKMKSNAEYWKRRRERETVGKKPQQGEEKPPHQELDTVKVETKKKERLPRRKKTLSPESMGKKK